MEEWEAGVLEQDMELGGEVMETHMDMEVTEDTGIPMEVMEPMGEAGADQVMGEEHLEGAGLEER